MHAYLNLVRDIFAQGSWQENRTGIRTLSLPGAMMKFDLQSGFPAVTTKKLAFRAAIAEMIGFLRAYRNAADFRALGCRVWDQNANENPQWLQNPYRQGENDLGAIYGVQWRQWPAYRCLDPQEEAAYAAALADGYQPIATIPSPEVGASPRHILYQTIDQLRHCLDLIMTEPTSRRILFHGWNCAQLEEMALPPCHLLYQFLVNVAQQDISLCVYVRSNDIGLGAPFNLAESAALLHLIGRLSGYRPRWLNYFIGDAHIYENHVEMLQEQLQRTPFPAPQLALSARIPDYAKTRRYEPQWLEQVDPDDFQLVNYQHHQPLTAPMAV